MTNPFFGDLGQSNLVIWPCWGVCTPPSVPKTTGHAGTPTCTSNANSTSACGINARQRWDVCPVKLQFGWGYSKLPLKYLHVVAFHQNRQR